jgi:hypothetical protein
MDLNHMNRQGLIKVYQSILERKLQMQISLCAVFSEHMYREWVSVWAMRAAI